MKLHPGSDARADRILRAVATVHAGGSVFYQIADTPTQSVDVIRVLVDGVVVVGFELTRDDPRATPGAAMVVHVEEFAKGTRGMAAQRLRAIRELASRDFALLLRRGAN
jgi:hypothetical protein